MPPLRAQRGFSLIELMVALVVGLIVSGALLAFTISSVRANAEYVSAARLTQEPAAARSAGEPSASSAASANWARA